MEEVRIKDCQIHVKIDLNSMELCRISNCKLHCIFHQKKKKGNFVLSRASTIEPGPFHGIIIIQAGHWLTDALATHFYLLSLLKFH